MGALTEVKPRDLVKALEESFFSEAQYALRRDVCPRTLQREFAKGVGVKPTIIHKKRYYEKRAVYEFERREKAAR
jgi:hypothetical protein